MITLEPGPGSNRQNSSSRSKRNDSWWDADNRNTVGGALFLAAATVTGVLPNGAWLGFGATAAFAFGATVFHVAKNIFSPDQTLHQGLHPRWIYEQRLWLGRQPY